MGIRKSSHGFSENFGPKSRYHQNAILQLLPGPVVSVLAARLHVQIVQTPVLEFLTEVLDTNLNNQDAIILIMFLYLIPDNCCNDLANNQAIEPNNETVFCQNICQKKIFPNF